MTQEGSNNLKLNSNHRCTMNDAQVKAELLYTKL
jgi:hypothetical protein